MSKVKIQDILDYTVYEESLRLGYIQTQTHPSLPFTIHNYSKSCTWDAKWNFETNSWELGWNEATLACRGLITNSETGEVLARPFLKFFNNNQPGAPVLDLLDEVIVTDKVDGSMGILYPIDKEGNYAIATRGSFASDQAVWGTEIWNKKYADSFAPNPSWTYLFEIIVPQNRIVIQYKDMEDLILLGAVDIASGEDIPLELACEGWTGPVVNTFPYKTYGEALMAPDRDNAEGFVLFHKSSNTRVKIKQAEYIRLHRILTNVNRKAVWEILVAGEDPVEIFSDAPDEFHAWLKSTINSLNDEFNEVKEKAILAYHEIINSLPTDYSRRDYAAIASTKHEFKKYLFLLLDDRDISPIVWEEIRPVGLQASQKIFTGGGDDE